MSSATGAAEKKEDQADWDWFEKVFTHGEDRPGGICLVSPGDTTEEWRIFNNTSAVHTEFCFTNDKSLTKLVRERAKKATKSGQSLRVLLYLTRLCACPKKCLCHRGLREWLSEFISSVDFRFIFGSLSSLNRTMMNSNPKLWMSHMESLLNLLHFAELHPKLGVETITMDTFNEFVKVNEFEDSYICKEEPDFYNNARKCLEGIQVYAENFDFLNPE